MTNLSKNRTAEVFGVDRSTLFAWIRRGCPCVDAKEPGKAAQLDFQAVLRWRKETLTQQWGRWISSDESMQRIAEMEATVRQRLKAFKPRRRACK